MLHPLNFVATVNAHLMAAARRSRSFLTRDIDALLEQRDLDSLLRAAQEAGYTAKRIIGGYALLRPYQHLSETVHLLFAGEKPKSSYPVTNPELAPEDKTTVRIDHAGSPLKDLLILKLNSLWPKDVVHIQVLDEVGFITPGIERQLPEAILERLKSARHRFGEYLDVEPPYEAQVLGAF